MDLFEYAEITKGKYILINGDGKSNFHTHTWYCDGNDNPDDMVNRALELGFTELGFSGHQYSDQDADYAMSHEKETEYRNHIEGLKEEYRDKIKIYTGIERDYCCEEYSEYDYVIGSCHHVAKDGEWVGVDNTPWIVEDGVERLFGGDYMEYVKAYYEIESKVLAKTRGQIVGHFDLVTKFNKDNKYFDETSEEYKRLAIESADRIIDEFVQSKRSADLPSNFPERPGFVISQTGMPIFEINTGITVSGRRDIPYPAPFIIEHLAKRGVPMILNSDCHDKRYLDFGFGAVINRYVNFR